MSEYIRAVLVNEQGKILFTQQPQRSNDTVWGLPGGTFGKDSMYEEAESDELNRLLGITFIGIADLYLDLKNQLPKQAQRAHIKLGLTEDQLHPNPELVRGLMWTDESLLHRNRIPYDPQDQQLAKVLLARFKPKLERVQELLRIADVTSTPSKFSITR